MTSEFPGGWVETTLGAFAPFAYGKSLPKRDRDEEGEVPVFGSNGVVGRHSQSYCDGPGVIVGRKGSIGEVAYSERPYWPIDTTFFVEAAPERDQRFTYYLLRSLPLAQMNTDSAVPGLNRNNAHALKLAVPPLREQQAIAELLGALDAKIGLNSAMARTAMETVEALFVSLCLGKDSDTWPIARLPEIAEFINGRNFTKEASGDGRMVIRIAELNSGPGNSTVYNDVQADARHLASPGDLLFAWSGSLGVHRWYRDQALINQHIFKVTPADRIPDWFVWGHLKTAMPLFRGYAADKATTMGHIKRSHLQVPDIPIPPPEHLATVGDRVSPLWDRWLAVLREMQVLEAVREALLPRLVSGHLRIELAEQTAEDS